MVENIINLIGKHEWQIIELGNGYISIVPDLDFIVRAILFLICSIYVLKGIFSLIRSI